MSRKLSLNLAITLNNYSETSLARPAMGPKKLAGVERWPVL
jgi:hypothetical protein